MNKWIAQELINRYGRGYLRNNWKMFSKLIKLLIGGLKIKDTNDISCYLIILVAELYSNNIEDAHKDDKYVVRPVNQALSRYLAEETNSYFKSAITNILSGATLLEEEINAVEEAFNE